MYQTAITIFVAAVTAWLTAYGSAYFTEVFRVKSNVIMSPGGVSKDTPSQKVTLTGDTLVILDNMTKDILPKEIDDIKDEYNADFDSQLAQAAASIKDTLQGGSEQGGLLAKSISEKLRYQLRHPKTYQISVESVENALKSISDHPSQEYEAYRAGIQVGNEQVDVRKKVTTIINESKTVSEAITKLEDISKDTAESLQVMNQTGDFPNYETFARFVDTLDFGNPKASMWSQDVQQLDQVKALVGKAEQEKVAGVRLSVFVSITNMAQTPATISKFGLFETADHRIMIPIEIGE